MSVFNRLKDSELFVIDYTRERKKFYSNLNLKNITDNKKFWKNIKPFFSNKGISKTEITLIEGEKIISNDLEVANTLNSFFETCYHTLRDSPI